MFEVESFVVELIAEVEKKCQCEQITDVEISEYVTSRLDATYDRTKWNTLITLGSTYMTILVAIAADRVYLYPMLFHRSTDGVMSMSSDVYQLKNQLEQIVHPCEQDLVESQRIANNAVKYAIDLGFAQILTNLASKCKEDPNLDVESQLKSLLLSRWPSCGGSVWVQDTERQADGTVILPIQCRIRLYTPHTQQYSIRLVKSAEDKPYQLSKETMSLCERLVNPKLDKE